MDCELLVKTYKSHSISFYYNLDDQDCVIVNAASAESVKSDKNWKKSCINVFDGLDVELTANFDKS